ncbi:hypothetical protein CL645_05530 [bacterium]|nr:hypothetical protein [bacterium]
MIVKNSYFLLFLVVVFSSCLKTTKESEVPRIVEQTLKSELSPWEEDQMLTQLNTRDLLRRKMSEPLAYELLARPNIPQEKHRDAINYLKDSNDSTFGDEVINISILLIERGLTLAHLGILLMEAKELDFDKTWDAIGKLYTDETLTPYLFAGLLLSDYDTAKSAIEKEEDGVFILISSTSLVPDGEVRKELTNYVIAILSDAEIEDLNILEAGILAMKNNEYGLNVMRNSLMATAENHSSINIRFAALEALGNEVKTIEMKAIPIMKYDINSFSVKPGQPVRIILKNEESMPHNVVIVEPGSFPDRIIEDLATLYGSADASGLDYIPQTDTVLFHTAMINVDESTELLFFAPESEGVYPYLCTYPGHWATMNGVMEVKN